MQRGSIRSKENVGKIYAFREYGVGALETARRIKLSGTDQKLFKTGS